MKARDHSRSLKMVPLASSGMTLLVVNTTGAWGLIFDIFDFATEGGLEIGVRGRSKSLKT